MASIAKLPSKLPIKLASSGAAATINRSPSNTFSFTQATTGGPVLEIDSHFAKLPQALPIKLATVDTNTFPRSVSQTFLAQTVAANFVDGDADNDLGFVDVVESNISVLPVSNSFGFTNEVTRKTFFRLAANLFFQPTGQTLESNFVFLDLSNEFSFSQPSGYNQDRDIHQYIGFTPRFIAPTLSNNLRINDFSNKVGVVFSVSPTDTFSFLETLKRAYPISNTFVLTSVAIGLYRASLFDYVFLTDPETLTFTDSDIDRGPTHSVVKQSVAFKVTSGKCIEREYTPFVGESDDTSFTAPTTIPPTLGTETLTLEEAGNPAVKVVLKSPEFGNADDLFFAQIDRRTRGGDRKVHTAQGWLELQTFRLTVRYVCPETQAEMIDFLNDSLGKKVVLTDWEDRQWLGLILAPDTDIRNEQGGLVFDIVLQGAPTVYSPPVIP